MRGRNAPCRRPSGQPRQAPHAHSSEAKAARGSTSDKGSYHTLPSAQRAFKVTRLDPLQRQLEQASKAFDALKSTIATLQFRGMLA